jgi:uncharacterized alpha-E superfamily protein
MLSRVAENVFWLSRYLERASNIARFLEVNHSLSLDMTDIASQWEPLIRITGDWDEFESRGLKLNGKDVSRFLVLDQNYMNSVYSSLFKARENAKGAREILPVEVWEELNDLYLDVMTASQKSGLTESQIYSLCYKIKIAGMSVYGIAEETMVHGDAYQFFRLGNLLERADKTSRVVHAKYFYLLPSAEMIGTGLDDLHWPHY